jgi:hypothetical protein
VTRIRRRTTDPTLLAGEDQTPLETEAEEEAVEVTTKGTKTTTDSPRLAKSTEGAEAEEETADKEAKEVNSVAETEVMEREVEDKEVEEEEVEVVNKTKTLLKLRELLPPLKRPLKRLLKRPPKLLRPRNESSLLTILQQSIYEL